MVWEGVWNGFEVEPKNSVQTFISLWTADSSASLAMSSKADPKAPKVVKEQTIPTTYLPDGRVDVPLPADLTDKQKEAIASLRDRIVAACPEKGVDERYSHPVDYDFVRFLRARKWNVDDAFKMMMNTLVWRTANKPDLITEADIEPENRRGKVYFQDYDYNGHLICWIKVRLHKSSDSDSEMMRKLCMYWMEQGFRHVRPDVPATCVLFDMKGFGLSNMDYSYVKFIIDMFTNHYPDTLGVCAVVNSPWIFNGCWYIIKPWIDPVTASKVTFVNEKELKQIIPPSSLPTDLGGESTYDFAASYVPLADRPVKTDEVSTESTANDPSSASKAPEDSDDFSTSASTSASTSERKEKRKKKSKRSKKTVEETTTEDDETIVTTTVTSISTVTITEDVVVDE